MYSVPTYGPPDAQLAAVRMQHQPPVQPSARGAARRDNMTIWTICGHRASPVEVEVVQPGLGGGHHLPGHQVQRPPEGDQGEPGLEVRRAAAARRQHQVWGGSVTYFIVLEKVPSEGS